MNNQTEYRTMTRKNSNRSAKEIKAFMAEDGDFLRPMVRTIIQEFLEAEMARGGRRAERRARRRSLKLSQRLLSAQLDYAGG